jgi:hypothetical protein
MTFYLKSGTSYRITSKAAMDLHERLPVGTYVIQKDPFENLFLSQIENFEISSKLYGDTVRHTERILRTFEDRPNSTGVMLNGEKGSGKTLLAKNIAFEAAKRGVPTIVINQPWVGDKFNTLIQEIEQPVVVLFDEYEKVYDSDDQQKMLTLLDGVFPTKKLFVLTCNDKWRVDQHMRNRPGRIYYMLDFKGLAPEFIREYCEDNLKNQEHIERLVQISSMFESFNFDMLKATVEEMNRYGETPQEALTMLNAKPEFDSSCKYDVRLFVDGVEVKNEGNTRLDVEWTGNPLSKIVDLDFANELDEDGDHEWDNAVFYPTDLKKIENDGTVYVFTNQKGHRVILTKKKERSFNSLDMF